DGAFVEYAIRRWFGDGYVARNRRAPDLVDSGTEVLGGLGGVAGVDQERLPRSAGFGDRCPVRDGVRGIVEWWVGDADHVGRDRVCDGRGQLGYRLDARVVAILWIAVRHEHDGITTGPRSAFCFDVRDETAQNCQRGSASDPVLFRNGV